MPESIISKILNTAVPDLLFHYTTSAGLMGIVKSGKIWTTKIHYLNDKSELQLAFEYIKEEIHCQKSGIEKKRTDEELDNMIDSLNSIQTINLSVASFTKEGDQLSQWRGYGQIGNAYSLGFDGKRLLARVLEEKGFILIPCEYEEEKHRYIVKELVNLTSVVNVQNNPNYGKPPFHRMSFAEAALFIAPIIKSNAFKEENEWRLIGFPLSYSNANFRQGNYTLIPYWEFDAEVTNSLRKIIVGPSPESELSREAISGLLMQNNIFGPYEIICSKIPYRKI